MLDVSGFLQSRVDESASDEPLADLWRAARDLYAKKLWHQLTEVLDKLVAAQTEQHRLMELYENAIKEFETK